MRGRFVWRSNAFGLGLVYLSPYFLSNLSPAGAYFLPSKDLLHLVVLPTLAAVLLLGAVISLVSLAARSWFAPPLLMGARIVSVSILSLIAVKGTLLAGGHDWRNVFARIIHPPSLQPWAKPITFVAILLCVWLTKLWLPKWSRLLGSLGFAFGALGLIRLFVIWHGAPHEATTDLMSDGRRSILSQSSGSALPSTISSKPKRVVWIVFDESDFARMYPDGRNNPTLPNFSWLAGKSVFATDANSPASATLYSIPSLFMGITLGNPGLRFDKSGSLSLRQLDADWLPFEENSTIFGVLHASGRTASVLGFYHPYCKLFILERCDSFPYPEVFDFSMVLQTNLPDDTPYSRAYWSGITRRMHSLLPQYLDREDSLTFIHFNAPHLPATYADEIMNVSPDPDPQVEYSRNLVLADQLLGEIIQNEQQQAVRQDLLLVVSTDHWFRNRWYQPTVPDATRPIPLLVWKVGETDGFVIQQPISTVHTSQMILDFLDGKLSSQSDIAAWWARQTSSASFIAPSS